MISCRFSFVKHFFQVFSNFFSAFIRKIFNFSYPGSVELGRRSRKQLDYVTTRSFVCQALFSDFSNLFSSTQLTFELVACALSSAQLSYQTCRFLSIGKISNQLINIMHNFSHIYLYRTDKHISAYCGSSLMQLNHELPSHSKVRPALDSLTE